MITYDQKKQIQKAAYGTFNPLVKPSLTAINQVSKKRVV